MKRIVACMAMLAPSVARAEIFDTANFVETNVTMDVGATEITSMSWAPDGSNRLFLTSKGGAIVIVKNGVVLEQRFATVSPVFTNSECGLLSLAFDSRFIDNQFVYVFATVSGSEQQVIRYRADGDTGTDKTVMYDHLPTLGQNHDGGAMVVGPDGMIYWSIGNNGNRDLGTADDKSILAAKVGRARPIPHAPAPSDNPFYDGDGPNNDYIWARSFRNPFTMTMQPSTGLLWIDVVGDRYEQLFVTRKGDHAGYPAENPNPGGLVTMSPVFKYRTNHDPSDVDSLAITATGAARAGGVATFTTTQAHGFRKGERVFITDVDDGSFDSPAEGLPVASVPSPTQFTVAQAGADATSGHGTAKTAVIGYVIAGGTHYDATQFPAPYRGNFFVGDFGTGLISRLPLGDDNLPTDVQPFGNAEGSWIDGETGPDGALYFVTHQGKVNRIVFKRTQQALVVSRLNTWIMEGGKAVLMVSLAQEPADDVVVNVARSGGDSDVSITGASALTFTPGNWSVPQIIHLAAAVDGDTTTNEQAAISVTSTGVTTEVVTVHVIDPDGLPQLPPTPDGGVPDAAVVTADARVIDAGVRDAAVASDARAIDGGTRDAAVATADARRVDGGAVSGDDSGCSCRTGGAPSWTALLPMALVLATLRRRRRKRG